MKKMFANLFLYAEDGEENKRNVSVATACQYFECVFSESQNPYLQGKNCQYLSDWCAFLKSKSDQGKLNVVTSDLWSSFLDLY